MIEVSIICPVYNEEKYISRCIESMLVQDYGQEQMELILVDGGSEDGTLDRIEPYLKDHPAFIRLCHNKRRTAPYAMNLGIEQAKGAYIVRIDAHSVFPNNYVSTLLHYLTTLPNAYNVGASCITLPANETATARAIATAMGHKFGMGTSTFRTEVVNKPTKVDTVPFGCWRKEMFAETGMFDTELTRNQDDEMNARIIRDGGDIYLIPNLTVTYYSRDGLEKTAAMFYQYGLYKPLVNKKAGCPATLRQFVPLFFLLGLTAGLPLCFLSKWVTAIYMICVMTYLLTATVIAIKNKNAMLIPVFPCIHLSYGWGYLTGIIKLIFNRPLTVTTNR